MPVIIFFPLVAIIYLVLGRKIRNNARETRQGKYLLGYFTLIGFGLLINTVYGPFAIVWVHLLGNFLSLFLVLVGLISLMHFSLCLQYSELEYTKRTALLVFSGFTLLALATSLAPLEIGGDFMPIWSPLRGILALITGQTAFLVTFVATGKVFKTMEETDAKKRLTIFLGGTVFMNLSFLALVFSNLELLPREVGALLLAFLILAGILIYKSFNRSPKSN